MHFDTAIYKRRAAFPVRRGGGFARKKAPCIMQSACVLMMHQMLLFRFRLVKVEAVVENDFFSVVCRSHY